MGQHNHRHVLLVGSVPLKDSHEVFETVSGELGSAIARIPDGETGDRTQWVVFQGQIMARTANLEVASSIELNGLKLPRYGLVDPAQPVKFGRVRYADEAMASYKDFAALKTAGKIDAGTRFQVSLPTPMAIMFNFVDGRSQQPIEAAYEARLLEELQEIAAAIPPAELAIQWDVAVEVLILAGHTGHGLPDSSRASMMDKLVRLGDAVPDGVELGYHLCYGDPGHKHVIEPTDLRLCVEMSNELAERVARRIDWIHMPVPKDRSDDTYFAPLRDLKTAPETEIFIGLVHMTDGVEGATKRIATAQKYRQDFGIATECGFGRRPPETVKPLLALHKALVAD